MIGHWVLAVTSDASYYLGKGSYDGHNGEKHFKDVQRIKTHRMRAPFSPVDFVIGAHQDEVEIEAQVLPRMTLAANQVLAVYWLTDFAIEAHGLTPNPAE